MQRLFQWSDTFLQFPLSMQQRQRTSVQRPHFSSAVKNVDHEALWQALMNVLCRPGAHAPNCSVSDCDECIERKFSSAGSTQHDHVGERLVIEMSLMKKGSILNAQSFCGEVCERSVLCELLSLRDIAKRFLLRTASDAVHVFSLSRSWDRRKIYVSVRFLLTTDLSVNTLHSTSLSCKLNVIFMTRALQTF